MAKFPRKSKTNRFWERQAMVLLGLEGNTLLTLCFWDFDHWKCGRYLDKHKQSKDSRLGRVGHHGKKPHVPSNGNRRALPPG